MKSFQELYPLAFATNFGSSFRVVDCPDECVFFVTDIRVNGIPKVFTTSLKAAAECTSTTQACTHFCSVLSCLFDNQVDLFVRILKHYGVNTKLVSLPSQAQNYGITMQHGLKQPEMLIIFGQCFLILFKNISTLNYDTFIKGAVEAMSIICGLHITTPPSIAFTADRAAAISRMLGQDPELKRMLMNVVLQKSEQSTIIGKLMGYLSGMAAWHEMTALVYINDTLLRTKSPILHNPKVATEVEAVGEAFKIINQSARPQFFMIYAKTNEMKALEITKFPTLVAVAAKLKAETNATDLQFISTGNVNSRLVDELVAIHKAEVYKRVVTPKDEILANLLGNSSPRVQRNI